jgi:hypothetical protein
MDKEQTPAVRKANQHFRKEEQAREGLAAWKEYNAKEEATRQKTAKLREQRLAREATATAAPPAKPAKPAKKAASRRAPK